jgi:hypothetical protein
MCAHRTGPWSEAIRSGAVPRPARPGEAKRRNSDPVAEQAQEFAQKLEDLAGVLASPLDETDAAWVNANIGMVAEEADDLISTLVDDAEDKGLDATGDWMKIPLVEQRAFEVPRSDPAADRADDEHDRKMNS